MQTYLSISYLSLVFSSCSFCFCLITSFSLVCNSSSFLTNWPAGSLTAEFVPELANFLVNSRVVIFFSCCSIRSCKKQVQSLSSFEVSCQLLTNGLNQVSELTLHPSLTVCRAVLLPFPETTKEPGCSQVKRPKFLSKFGQIFGLFT